MFFCGKWNVNYTFRGHFSTYSFLEKLQDTIWQKTTNNTRKFTTKRFSTKISTIFLCNSEKKVEKTCNLQQNNIYNNNVLFNNIVLQFQIVLTIFELFIVIWNFGIFKVLFVEINWVRWKNSRFFSNKYKLLS